MSTTPIAFQAPVGDALRLYNRSLSATLQVPSIPQTFCDSMAVRENVFVDEMKAVPLEHHMDIDDARSWHWTLYICHESQKVTAQPIGTIRLVPFPHYPHPEPGAQIHPPVPDAPILAAETFFSTPSPPYVIDRKTRLHDGVEPFLKLGRLCVVTEFRGRKFADRLVQTALGWAANESMAFQKEGAPEWKGLVCVHAQEKAVSTWQRNGFAIDEEMGTWFEAGIKHYGMFTRVALKG